MESCIYETTLCRDELEAEGHEGSQSTQRSRRPCYHLSSVFGKQVQESLIKPSIPLFIYTDEINKKSWYETGLYLVQTIILSKFGQPTRVNVFEPFWVTQEAFGLLKCQEPQSYLEVRTAHYESGTLRLVNVFIPCMGIPQPSGVCIFTGKSRIALKSSENLTKLFQ